MNELEFILTDIFKCSRTDLYLNSPSIAFGERELRSFEKVLRDRGRLNPIQYILGRTEFMGLELKVKKGVLIPRPETEILVEAIIEEAENLRPRILDIGTGSGCIAIALAKFLKKADIVAIDISREAIDVAIQNAKLHKVDKKIRFLHSDLFKHKFFKEDFKFDIIVSNPPYVPRFEIGLFDKKIIREPKIALDGGVDGLDFYRRLNREANRFLEKEGLLFLELGDGQAERIKEIFLKGWTIKKFINDYQHIKRVCVIRNGKINYRRR